MELPKEKYQELVRHLSNGILIVGESGDILYESPSVQRITGYPPAERVGNQVFEHVHPDDQQKVRETFAEILDAEDDEVVTDEFRYRHKDDSWIWLETRGSNQTATAIGGYVVSVRDITETKERENRLKQTTARLEALFESSPDMIDIHTTDGTIVDVNQQFCEAFNQPKDEIVGQKVWDIDQEIDSDELQAIWDGMDVGDRKRIETEFETHDGTRFPVEVHLTRLPVGDGDRFMVVSRDITERTQRIEEIERLKERLELAIEGANLGVWDWDMTTDEVEFNEQWAEMLGYTLDELEPHLHTWESRVHPDDLDDVTAALEAHRQQQTDYYDTEHRMRTADGEWKWIRDLGKIVERDDDGEPIRAVGIHLDVDEWKTRERQLEALNRVTQELMSADTREEVAEIGVETMRDLLELEANSIHLYDDVADGLVPVASTDAVYDLIGEPPTFAGGDSIAWRVYQRGETLSVDDVHEDPDRYNPATPIRSELILPLGKYGVLLAGSSSPETFDEQDALLGEILAGGLATALEQLERTEQLRARERELTEQNDRLEEFASIVSHDLRNPLTVAEGRLELAATECDSEHLDSIEQAHERMRTLIDELLSLAREGDAVTDFDLVALDPLVEECWATVETGAATLITDTDRTVRADKSRLKQLFENLIRNAIDHGGEDVTVTVGALDDGFYVEDDGQGIPADKREDVLRAGYSTSEDGTGFGLSIVKQIVAAHDWQIRVTDSTTNGARFEIHGVEAVTE
ncbi:two-component system sensor histidine kinase/response regulator [Natrinema sp. CBA1119]|uniref:PAS domain S-box protein n=1 Tax=Natrinema sp. CBA1119 TaxID=1608465 RepID=UPI000BF85423|nr:PAS domain S-box protein [Natrinema sp. CBA1119]PGF14907.1 two-component system sensor histidine kinase/response regulator [Natrinema sp. CBA1119]